MKIEIKVPQAGESVTEAMISEWFKQDGEFVERDEAVLEFETDKANMELTAEQAGVLNITVAEGEVVKVGQVVGTIDTSVAAGGAASAGTDSGGAEPNTSETGKGASEPSQPLAPSVRRLVVEEGLDPDTIEGSGKDGRLLKEDALRAVARKNVPDPLEKPARSKPAAAAAKGRLVDLHIAPKPGGKREERVVPMSMLRRRIAQRLVEAQRDSAILSTFNEIDMSAVMTLRSKYKESFLKRHQVKLGFMSFFVKACIEALKVVPEINAMIENNNLIYRDYYDVGVAVGSQKGLVVPVIRDADRLSFAEVEKTIGIYGEKARNGKLSLDEISGGTFTISNGGIYGSLLSTPILNPPQSGILGMHKIEERPIAVKGQVVVRPMMYVALSYDHRVVDGKGAVTFLVKIKECIEDPTRILLEI